MAAVVRELRTDWPKNEAGENIPEEITPERLADQWWRLNNLYYILDEDAKKILFRPKPDQRDLYEEMWYLNIVLKARQLGFSTFIQLFILDCCLFNDNIRAGIVAHTKDAANEIFAEKIKYPFENLPKFLQKALAAKSDRIDKIQFKNNSSIRVSTTMRSGTLQYLHVSEYGKIAANDPKKAREIKTGSFETVHTGHMIFVESTAEGRSGAFYDLCESSKADTDNPNHKLSLMEFKFHFYPWWGDKKNRIDPDGVIISARMVMYFKSLEAKYGIPTDPWQRAWYVIKEKRYGDDMKRENPSTAEEAFEAAVQGAYWGNLVTDARSKGRIGNYPYNASFPVDTWWDIGFHDDTSIWFTQDIGGAIHVIDYYEMSGEGLPHYVKMLAERKEEYGYHYGRHVWPHDGGNHEWGTGDKRSDTAAGKGLKVEVKERGSDKQLSIESVREVLPVCYFHEITTEPGIIHLENYRKGWDDVHGVWKKKPLHNEHSNGADAFQTLGMAHDFSHKTKKRAPARTGPARIAG